MLYIIRHGKTDWNVRHKLQGRTDIPLNEEGRQMAETARKEYRDVHFDICFCSPLIRAKETAEILLRDRNIPILTDDRLMEMSFGCFEGIENSFSIPDCPVNELFFHPEQYVAQPGAGESLDDLFAGSLTKLIKTVTGSEFLIRIYQVLQHLGMHTVVIVALERNHFSSSLKL